MERHNGGRGKPRQPDAIRNSGWRPPYVEGRYQDIVLAIGSRAEFKKDRSTRYVIEAAILAMATKDELDEIGWDG